MLKISYWVYPIISGVVWLGTLLGLLIWWCVDADYAKYPSMGPTQTIAYISDVGAQKLKPLFITGCVITTVFLDISFLSDRWLRHKGRLVPNTTITEKVLSGLTIVFAIVGTAGLILLSIFDTLRHPRLHDVFLLLFIAGYILSAIFICWEYQRLGVHYQSHRVLRISFWIKLLFILVEVCLAIAFGVCNFRKASNAAAVLEWAIAFIFSFYVFSFYVDLFPAVHTRHTGAGHLNGPFGDGGPTEGRGMGYGDGHVDGPGGNVRPNGHYANGGATKGYAHNGYANGGTGPHNNF
ncbi:Frag1/DRAM/Sfk1 family-domain-containing protein [Coniochaeta sp. 2T2.1]|nr:Frag1/DRAM/Sfk1 family-domain-containing protein [Coniochaeta sp. 2T2.1]